MTSSTLWTVVSALFFLREKITSNNIIGILLITAGIIAVNYSKTKWKFNKGHLYALFSAFMFGIAFTNDAFIIKKFSSVSSYMFLSFVLSTIAIFILRPKLVRGISHFIKKDMIGKLFICGLFYSLMIVTIFEAYKRGGQVTIINPIQQSSLILTVVASYFLLKEKDKLPNKIIGTFLTFIGVLLLV